METQTKLSGAARIQFHKIYKDWLASASDEETDMLELAMEQSAVNEVRSMPTFICGCLADVDLKQSLPPRLIQALEAKSWPPVESFGQVHAFHAGEPS